jgi:hypothetical protein
MSKVTDRLTDQNVINLALQQFEAEKRKKLPSVVVSLTSQGKVYPETHPLRAGTIEMRYMTAYDEDILTNSSYMKQGILFDKLLEAIILTPVKVNEIAEVDKFGLILNARILAYGADYDVVVKDPKTGNELKRTINLSNVLKSKPITLQPDKNGEFVYQVDNSTTLKYKLLINESTTTVSDLLKKIITQINDTRDPAAIENFIRYEFLAMDAKRFRKHIQEVTPDLDLTVEIEGEDGSTFSTGFPIGPELFWF